MLERVKKYFDPKKINDRLNHLSSYLGAKVRDALVRFKHLKVKAVESVPKSRKDFKTFRENSKKNYDKAALRVNEKVVQLSQTKTKILSGIKTSQTMSKLMSKKWFKPTIIGLAALTALSLAEKVAGGFNSKPVIPNKYEKGYESIKENLTDFGSPVKLIKTASKVLVPYKSTVRKALKTDVSAIYNKNIALVSNKHAINHMRY